MNYGMVLAATAVMALVTYLPRMLPMAVMENCSPIGTPIERSLRLMEKSNRKSTF